MSGDRKIPEKVIVCLQDSVRNYRTDAELPSQMLIPDLRKGILALLKEYEPGKYAACTEISLSFNGSSLRDSQTLASQGIWDGSVLEIR